MNGAKKLGTKTTTLNFPIATTICNVFLPFFLFFPSQHFLPLLLLLPSFLPLFFAQVKSIISRTIKAKKGRKNHRVRIRDFRQGSGNPTVVRRQFFFFFPRRERKKNGRLQDFLIASKGGKEIFRSFSRKQKRVFPNCRFDTT